MSARKLPTVKSHEVRQRWAERSGEYSPAYYADYGPDATSEALVDVFDRHLNERARLLELGCSSGRHLAHLCDNGFTNLTGVELNPDAFEVMAGTYPRLAATGSFHEGAIEEVLDELGDGAYDAIFSVETLQHIHPESSWVFEEVARVTADLLVTVENEGEEQHGINYVNDEFPLYYRDWEAVFSAFGLRQIEMWEKSRDTMRVFRVVDN